MSTTWKSLRRSGPCSARLGDRTLSGLPRQSTRGDSQVMMPASGTLREAITSGHPDAACRAAKKRGKFILKSVVAKRLIAVIL